MGYIHFLVRAELFRPETVLLVCEGLKKFLEGAGSPLPLPP